MWSGVVFLSLFVVKMAQFNQMNNKWKIKSANQFLAVRNAGFLLGNDGFFAKIHSNASFFSSFFAVTKLPTSLQEFTLSSHQMDTACRVLPNSLLGRFAI